MEKIHALLTKIIEIAIHMLFYYWYAHSIIFLILNYKNLSLTLPYIWAIMGILAMIKNQFKRGNKND